MRAEGLGLGGEGFKVQGLGFRSGLALRGQGPKPGV